MWAQISQGWRCRSRAAALGISKVTLYKYVTSKEELLCRVFDRTIQTFRAGLRHIVGQPLPADEKLRRIIRTR